MKFKEKKTLPNGKVVAVFEEANNVEFNVDSLMKEKKELEDRLEFIKDLLKQIPK